MLCAAPPGILCNEVKVGMMKLNSALSLATCALEGIRYDLAVRKDDSFDWNKPWRLELMGSTRRVSVT